ncbi:hypothetical protein Misp01_30020 [Microtetraspora sp. NBRC 13810]|uniref:hypothetical protein n=1 Tax=Microtetraspora sp. NBRC 13810 TaxID=3030990 RepID=UPI0024A4ADAC|nr:hypothetical protein [Microtetraspora sp. NBRC 13810]GLW07872.1 hypothetical protein Misp01_30020 [Microtetraspora sp. NBRC 13810]
MAVSRRYDGGPAARLPAELRLSLQNITDMGFDSGDTRGIAFDPEAEEIVIRLGVGGVLRATTGTAYLDDPAWHLSTAGRAADRRTPPYEEGVPPTVRRRSRQPEGAVAVAAGFLHSAMLEMRMVRYAHLSERTPVWPLARALTGAGTDILAAGARRGGRREKAFRDLGEAWIDRGGDALTPGVADRLRRLADLTQLPDRTRAWLEGITPPSVPAPHATGEPDPALAPETELRLVKYSAAHIRHEREHDAFAVVTLAVPHSDQDSSGRTWRLRTRKIDNVSHFRLRSDAFAGAQAFRTMGESMILGNDTLRVRGKAVAPPAS